MELAHSLLKRHMFFAQAPPAGARCRSKRASALTHGFFARAPPAGAGCRNKRVSTLMRTLFLRQNRLELSKGVFTGDGSGLG